MYQSAKPLRTHCSYRTMDVYFSQPQKGLSLIEETIIYTKEWLLINMDWILMNICCIMFVELAIEA